MADLQARFGLKVLPLSQKDKAVEGEVVLDPNTGHIYVKNNGVLISKTLELEERLNNLMATLKNRTTNVSFTGSEISKFTTDMTDITVSTVGLCAVTKDKIVLDKEPILLDVNSHFKYRVIVRYKRGASTIGLECNVTNTNTSETIGINVISNSVYAEHTTTVFDLTSPPRMFGGTCTLSLTNCTNTSIYSVSIIKTSYVNNTMDTLTLLPTDNEVVDNVGEHTITNTGTGIVYNEKIKYYDNVTTSTFRLYHRGLMSGTYSFNVLMLAESSGILTVTMVDNNGTTVAQKIDVDTLSTTNDNTMKIATITVEVPLIGVNKMLFRSTASCKIMSATFSPIQTAAFNCNVVV